MYTVHSAAPVTRRAARARERVMYSRTVIKSNVARTDCPAARGRQKTRTAESGFLPFENNKDIREREDAKKLGTKVG